jgi:hypothetical protein
MNTKSLIKKAKENGFYCFNFTGYGDDIIFVRDDIFEYTKDNGNKMLVGSYYF